MTFKLRVRTLVLLGAALGIVAIYAVNRSVCLTAWARYGAAFEHCPDGKVRATYVVVADGLRRGATGEIRIAGAANYTVPGAESAISESFVDFEPELTLVDAAGKAVPLPLEKDTRWTEAFGAKLATVRVPELNDGDYSVRAKLHSRFGDETVDVPVGFFAPARVHVLTDRPLYEPGQQILFRSVVLRAQDFSPLEDRPGRWTVIDPSGETVLEEKRPAGPWGVAAGSFPLDRGAPAGSWRIRWTSGDAYDEAVVRVEPFTVPRFRLEAAPVQSFYGRGGRPVVKGAVIYASGAPVANAALEISWNVTGEWPAPTAWNEGALPQRATAGRDGRFALELPEVPLDLRGRGALVANLTAVDSAGDRVSTQTAVSLSEDAIAADAVTELGDGLVEGFNNRMYVRATRADGVPLSGATVLLKRAWDPKDKGVTAVADEDGVASVQIDPGAAVNVVVPAMPYRPPPAEPSISLDGARELIGGDELTLADQLSVERSLSSFEPCALLTLEERTETVAVRITRAGTVSAAVGSENALGRCLANVARARGFSPGGERLLALSLSVTPPDAPYLAGSVQSTSDDAPQEVQTAVYDALLSARSCLPRDTQELRWPRGMEWRTSSESNVISLSWVDDPNGERAPAAAVACVASRVPTRVTAPAKLQNAIGYVGIDVVPAGGTDEGERPQATTYLGYDFLVSATQDGRSLGSTHLRLRPGSVPYLRLRPSTVVASVGETVELQLLRGPTYGSELPEYVNVRVGAESDTLKVADKKVTFTVPKDARGWLEFETNGARALVFVRSGSDLTVAVSPDKESYAPGDLAHLKLETRIAGKPGQVAVGLFGVDETLGQLAPLPGADSLAKVRPAVAMSSPAFGALEAQALVLGRIRGANAAAATVLRVSAVPAYAQVDAPANGRTATGIDTNGELTDAFYNVLAELHAQARQWESSAPAEELASPATVAKLWGKALETCEGRQQKVTDAFGRKLRLSMLPQDLLALTDPRAVIIAGTRLPEDVENWSNWVAEEAP